MSFSDARRRIFKSVTRLVWLAGFAGMLAGCGEVNLRWKEEVRMAGGEMLLVDRTAQGKTDSPFGAPGGWDQKRMTLEVLRLPENWIKPPVWSEPYVPILLDYQPEGRVWSVVATFYYCNTWYELGRPLSPYLEYQSKDGGSWERIPLEDRLMGRKTNLLADVDAGGEPDLVTAEERERRDRNAGKIYQAIVTDWGGC
jgi:hypothetical protein